MQDYMFEKFGGETGRWEEGLWAMMESVEFSVFVEDFSRIQQE